MPPKYKIIFAIVVLGIVGIFVYAGVVSFLSEEQPAEIVQEGQQTGNQVDNQQTGSVNQMDNGEPKTIDMGTLTNGQAAPQLTTEEQEQKQLETMAKNFVERFGSYSTSSRFENFDDLARFMTPSMQEWADGIEESVRADYPNTFYGLMTRATSAQVLTLDQAAGTAQVRVYTLQEETKGNQSTSFTQSVRLELVNVNGEWIVNGLFYFDDKQAS